ncbi:hypothetical protein MPSEU_000566300 [Mayamaea pseudoterrestris]|nr:hypothetical protein MPSEU_000566300 [Mayamaea pseudoterrestris]
MNLRLTKTSSGRNAKPLLPQQAKIFSRKADEKDLESDVPVGIRIAADASSSGMGNTSLKACCEAEERIISDSFLFEPHANGGSTQVVCHESSGDHVNDVSRSQPEHHQQEDLSGASCCKATFTSPTTRHKKSLCRQSSKQMNETVRATVTRLLKALKCFFFPKLADDILAARSNSAVTMVRAGILLHGCSDETEHYAKIKESVELVKDLRGEEGLRALGFEYRMLPCANHAPTDRCDEDDDEDECNDFIDHEDGQCLVDVVYEQQPVGQPKQVERGSEASFLHEAKEDLVQLNDKSSDVVTTDQASDNPYLYSMQPFSYSESLRSVVTDTCDVDDLLDEPVSAFSSGPKCMLCMRRLYHIATDTLVTLANRKVFIADGNMYESVARLCQENAIDAMCHEAKLEWLDVDIRDANGPGGSQDENLRVLVNATHPCLHLQASDDGARDAMAGRPSLLIATGRGKVRAGVFSREHLMGSGMELATALPMVREAMRRNMNVIIVDHNVCGEVNGFANFKKTMDAIANRLAEGTTGMELSDQGLSYHALYVVAHSASGGHLCRYLLEKQTHYLPRIQAIAFTDSTHNIQWCKRKRLTELTNLLESKKCVYFRSSKAREQDDNSLWYLHRSGEPIQTDEFWQHRFGTVNTYWAGTNEHSLTNWYAHVKIWHHFDDMLREASAENMIPNSRNILLD